MGQCRTEYQWSEVLPPLKINNYSPPFLNFSVFCSESVLVTCCFCMFYFTVDSYRISHVSVRESQFLFNHYKICGYGISRNALLHCCLIINFHFLCRTFICCTFPQVPPILANRTSEFYTMKVSSTWLTMCLSWHDALHSSQSWFMSDVISCFTSKTKSNQREKQCLTWDKQQKAGQTHKVPLLRTLKNR